MTAIVKHVLGEHIANEIKEDLQSTPFSVLVDESTDVSNKQLMCILVRHIKNGQLQFQFLDFTMTEAGGATAENLNLQFKKCLKKYNIPVSNIVGLGSDNANVMVGKNESFMTHLLKENPEVVVFRCSCHTTHLIASSACDELPQQI